MLFPVSISQAAGSYFLSSCSLLLFISSSQQCKGIVVRSMSSSPKTLYWCQRVSHFAKRNFPWRNSIPLEKRPTSQKNKLSKTLPSKTLPNLNLFSGVIQWDGPWEKQSLLCSGSSASDLQTCFWWATEAGHPYRGWAGVSGRGKSKFCTVPVLLEKHKCCVSY